MGLGLHIVIVLVFLAFIKDTTYGTTNGSYTTSAEEQYETMIVNNDSTISDLGSKTTSTGKPPLEIDFTTLGQSTEIPKDAKTTEHDYKNDSTRFVQSSRITTVTKVLETTNKINFTSEFKSVAVTTATHATGKTNDNANNTIVGNMERNSTQELGGLNEYGTTSLTINESERSTAMNNNPTTESSDTSIGEDGEESMETDYEESSESQRETLIFNCLIDNDGIDIFTFEIIETVLECCTLKIDGYDLHSFSSKEVTKAYEIVEIWISIFLVFFGLVGNILSFVVLYREKSSTSRFFLKTLSSCDALYCLWYLMFIPYSVAYEYTRWITDRDSDIVNWIPFHLPKLSLVNYVLQTISIWLVVLLTIDRYIAICFPLKAKIFCTLNNSRIQTAVLVVLSIGFAIPRGFQSYSSMSVNSCLGTRQVETNLTEFGSSFGSNIVYDVIMDGFVRYIIPVVIVFVANILLIRELKKAAANRVQLTSSGESNQQDRNINIMLVTVATTFLILILPQVGAKILKSLIILSHKNKISLNANVSTTTVTGVVLASNLALRINSSINFILYIVVSQRFRIGFVQLFRCARVIKTDRTSSGTRSTNSGSYTAKSEL